MIEKKWDKQEKLNLSLLIFAQALTTVISSIFYSFCGLAASFLSTQEELSTLPISLSILGTAVMAIPAAYIMDKIGRKGGFFLGLFFGFIGSFILCGAILKGSFVLLNVGSIFIGFAVGFSQYYRFAAGEIFQSPFLKTQAISYVLGAGIIGCFIGNPLANMADAFFLPYLFLGPFIIVMLAYLIQFFIIFFLNFPSLESYSSDPHYKKNTIFSFWDYKFIAALICGLVGSVVMMVLMTATPLAMSICHWNNQDISYVIQFHFIGMFAPSLFTGKLINKWGNARVIFIGISLNLLCVLCACSGTDISQFWVALVLLGLGWNFMYIASTDLLAKSFDGAAKKKAQSINEFLNYTATALGSFLAGVGVQKIQWKGLAMVALPLLLISAISLIYYSYRNKMNSKINNLNLTENRK